MIKKISKLINKYKDKKIEDRKKIERKILEEKVRQGTDFVIHEYKDAFRKLAEYDKN